MELRHDKTELEKSGAAGKESDVGFALLKTRK